MSATHFSFGRVAVKSRWSRSRARSTAASSAIVVRFLRAAELAFEPVLAHHPGDPVAADLDLAALELLPGLASAVDAAAAAPGRFDLDEQLTVGELARRRLPGSARVVRAHRHADRSGRSARPRRRPAALDVAGHRRRVGSSSVAK